VPEYREGKFYPSKVLVFSSWVQTVKVFMDLIFLCVLPEGSSALCPSLSPRPEQEADRSMWFFAEPA